MFAELKRRRVIKAAVVYAIVGWAVIQAAGALVQLLELPTWIGKAIFLVVVLAFPLALVFAWIFDVTPAGLRVAPAGDHQQRTSNTKAAFAGLTLMVALVGFAAYTRLSPSRSLDTGAKIESVAVLPFADLSPEGNQEYFSDGITEELLDALAKVPGLRVPARTSSFAFKGKNSDVRDIGKSLTVQAVLEGSVRKSGNRVRVTAQLINVASGYHVWSETYDREISDIFAIQDDISRAIVDALRLKLGAAGEQPLVKGATRDPTAHSLFLHGRFFWNKSDFQRAVQYLQEAIERDPTYAAAYAVLADCYIERARSRILFNQPEADDPSRGKAAARKALELDPSLAEAHTSLARILHLEDKLAESEAEYRTALKLNPNYAPAHSFYAILLRRLGRMQEAVREARIAYELDPLSAFMARQTGAIFYEARDYAAAKQQYYKAIELDRTGPISYNLLSRIYSMTGQGDSAVITALKAYEMDPLASSIDEIALAYAVAGRVVEARKYIGDYEKYGPSGDQRAAILLAVLYARIGDEVAAHRWLERAAVERPVQFAEQRGGELDTDPRLDVLRQNPRFRPLLKKLQVL
ncbi:MAG: tetratricopeptide repeat protein [Gemmatimonadota bacterium]